MKISEEFQNFLESDTSGTDDVVAEWIVKVVGDDHEAEIVLEQYGKGLFMECMKMAINVVISFEDEIPLINKGVSRLDLEMIKIETIPDVESRDLFELGKKYQDLGYVIAVNPVLNDRRDPEEYRGWGNNFLIGSCISYELVIYRLVDNKGTEEGQDE